MQSFLTQVSNISCSFISFSKIAERQSGSKVTVKTIGVGYQLMSINLHGLKILLEEREKTHIQIVINEEKFRIFTSVTS